MISMILIGIAISIVTSILGSSSSLLANRIVAWAARRLPTHAHDRFEEECLSIVNAVDDGFLRLFRAIHISTIGLYRIRKNNTLANLTHAEWVDWNRYYQKAKLRRLGIYLLVALWATDYVSIMMLFVGIKDPSVTPLGVLFVSMEFLSAPFASILAPLFYVLAPLRDLLLLVKREYVIGLFVIFECGSTLVMPFVPEWLEAFDDDVIYAKARLLNLEDARQRIAHST